MRLRSPPVESGSYHRKMAAVVFKLRALRHWTQNECALRAGFSLTDVQVIEDLRPTTTGHWDRRITALERAFTMPLRQIVSDEIAPGSGITVLPFVTTDHSIHQNSFEWTSDGILLDVVDHAPQFSLLPVALIKRFIGKDLPESFMHFVKRRASVQPQGVVDRPGSLWGHYQRLITAAKRDDYTAPLRYDAVTSEGQQVLREVTCVKLSGNCFETQTHVIAEAKRLDLECCGKYDDCRACMSADAARVFSRIQHAS